MSTPSADIEGISENGYPIYRVDPTRFPAPRQTRHEFLSGLHLLLQPRTYLEIGVAEGFGLELSKATTIGVDPEPRISRTLPADVEVVRQTSDEFFAGDDALASFHGVPPDLVFIDGMHLAEFALRDFVNVERLAGPGTVVVFDDVLPRRAEEAARERASEYWTGDVYKLVGILRDRRPDLACALVNTDPTGTLVVVGLDPRSTVLTDAYDEFLAGIQAPDPQRVPPSILDRTAANDALDALWWDGWPSVVAARDIHSARMPGDVVERFRKRFDGPGSPTVAG
ncbi:MAG: class I SAM-dependent methyltransferase [Humibacter sp.]